MPIFDFQCAKCGERFETLVRTKNATVSCPNCSSENVERQLSVFNASSGVAKAVDRCPSGASCAAAGAPPCCAGGSCGLAQS